MKSEKKTKVSNQIEMKLLTREEKKNKGDEPYKKKQKHMVRVP